MTRKALGRGLEALIPKRDEAPRVTHEDVAEHGDSPARNVHVDRIRSNRQQPRTRFDDTALEELAGSIRENGILQPLLVRGTEHGFELIAGERRLRAARMIGLPTVPVIIREDVDDQLSLRLALLENVQREDLNPIEEAKGYKRLIDEFRMPQQEIAQQLGKSRSTVANTVRLLSLPEDLQTRIENGELTPGHARALLSASSLDEQVEIARLVRERGLNVRETEILARRKTSKNPQGKEVALTPEVAELQRRMETRFGTRVRIQARRADGSAGRIEIDYYNSEDLERVFGLCGVSYLL